MEQPASRPNGSLNSDGAALRSVFELFARNADQHSLETAALVKRGGAYQEITWGAMAERVNKIASGLVAHGLQPGDRVALICDTRLEWVLVDMGILGAGGVTVPLYPVSTSHECQHVIDHCEAVIVVVEDHEQAEKLRTLRSRLDGLRLVVQIAGSVPAEDAWVITLADLERSGAEHTSELQPRRDSLNRDSLLTIIYTSGTTGEPKGVALTHGAMLYEGEALINVEFLRRGDVSLLYLPLAHSFARLIEFGWLATRHILAFAEGIHTVARNLAEVRPTIMAAVPRAFEKYYAGVVASADRRGGVWCRLFAEACALSEKRGLAEARGESLGLADRLRFRVLKRLVFQPVGAELKAAFGGRMRLMASGGAPLSRRINWFFRDAGILIVEGYGLTETSAGTCFNLPGKHKIGTVGRVIPGTRARIADDGEILIEGPGVMREYWKDPAATAKVLKEGWLHTGDVGEIDREGFLRITGRKKDLIVTASGKNIAPRRIENLVKADRLVSQVVVHGDRRSFLTALITLDKAALKEFAKEHDLGDASYALLSQKPEVYRAVRELVETVNTTLARDQEIKKFRILQHDFTIEGGELTPSLKVKRTEVNDRYRAIFDGFYEESY